MLQGTRDLSILVDAVETVFMFLLGDPVCGEKHLLAYWGNYVVSRKWDLGEKKLFTLLVSDNG